MLFFFCWVLGILCYLNKVTDRVPIPFLCPRRCWPSYPTKTPTISGVFFLASSGIYPQFHLCEALGFLYTCSSWVSIPKTQFVGFAYPINFLIHSLSGATNYKILLSRQTLKKLWKTSDFFCFVKLFVLDYLLWIRFFYGYALTIFQSPY